MAIEKLMFLLRKGHSKKRKAKFRYIPCLFGKMERSKKRKEELEKLEKELMNYDLWSDNPKKI